MKIFRNMVLVLALALTSSCQSNSKKNEAASSEKDTAHHIQKPTAQELDKLEKAYFASGCFWCVEAIFESVKGVKEVVSGYAGGSQANPTYEQVAGGRTDHAEAVKVYYDPEVISFTALVQVFFGSHDPTTLNRQGPDRGPQYRSIAFFQNDREKEIIEGYIKALKEQKVYQGEPITTEVTALSKFYEAEDYHQDYERKNPNNSYITNVSVPRLNRFKANFSDYLKEEAH